MPLTKLNKTLLLFLISALLLNIGSCSYMVYKYIEMSDKMTYSSGYKDGYNTAIKEMISNANKELWY